MLYSYIEENYVLYYTVGVEDENSIPDNINLKLPQKCNKR